MAEKMTYQEAVARIPDRILPEFWVGSLETLEKHLRRMQQGEVMVLATTPGQRPLYLVSYGEHEHVPHEANFNSALGAREPAAYMDKGLREKPVVYFIGPVHGQEVEGLTGLVNFIHVMETGVDLRGEEQPELRRLGEQCRLLIVPCGNPDGLARLEPEAFFGVALEDIRFWGQGTWTDDTFCSWPDCKRQHPMRAESVNFLGAYFNDEGINPMHDEFFAPMSAEVPALLRVARETGPDLATLLHSHQRPPALLRPAYVPLEVQAEVAQLAQHYYRALDAQGIEHASPYEAHPETGDPAPYFNLVSAVYHTSGAPTFTFECPHGNIGPDAYAVTPEQILDIQLTLYQAMLEHALAQKA